MKAARGEGSLITLQKLLPFSLLLMIESLSNLLAKSFSNIAVGDISISSQSPSSCNASSMPFEISSAGLLFCLALQIKLSCFEYSSSACLLECVNASLGVLSSMALLAKISSLSSLPMILALLQLLLIFFNLSSTNANIAALAITCSNCFF